MTERDIATERGQYLVALQEWQDAGEVGDPPVPPQPDPTGSLVYIGGDRFLFGRFGGQVDDADRGLHVEIEGTVVDGQPRCSTLSVWRLDGQPLEADDLRAIPLGDYVDQVASRSALVMEPGDSLGRFAAEVGATEAVGEQITKRRRGRITDAYLREVAALYRAAYAAGEHPTKTIAKQCHVGRSTAGRLVKRARDRGFLGPALKQKAGEADKETAQ